MLLHDMMREGHNVQRDTQSQCFDDAVLTTMCHKPSRCLELRLDIIQYPVSKLHAPDGSVQPAVVTTESNTKSHKLSPSPAWLQEVEQTEMQRSITGFDIYCERRA